MFMLSPIAMLELPDRSLLPVTLPPGRCLLGTTYDHDGARYVFEGRTDPDGVPILIRPPKPPAQDSAPAFETHWHGASDDPTGGRTKGRLMDECDGFENPLYHNVEHLDMPHGTLPSHLSLRTWASCNPMSKRDRANVAYRNLYVARQRAQAQ